MKNKNNDQTEEYTILIAAYNQINLNKAKKWYEMAVKQGDEEAHKNLALIYEEGKGRAQAVTEVYQIRQPVTHTKISIDVESKTEQLHARGKE